MAVKRESLSACIGCKLCYQVCPMDVFRFDEAAQKSVIAYPQNCQCCGQCYLHCPTGSIGIDPVAPSYYCVLSR